MIKVYICPECGWLRAVSRRKHVECHKCAEQKMELTKMSFNKFALLSEGEREDYVDTWMYIHNKKDKKK